MKIFDFITAREWDHLIQSSQDFTKSDNRPWWADVNKLLTKKSEILLARINEDGAIRLCDTVTESTHEMLYFTRESKVSEECPCRAVIRKIDQLNLGDVIFIHLKKFCSDCGEKLK